MDKGLVQEYAINMPINVQHTSLLTHRSGYLFCDFHLKLKQSADESVDINHFIDQAKMTNICWFQLFKCSSFSLLC